MSTTKPTQSVKYKICLVGDEAVGKTSLIRRFVYSAYEDKYIRTILTSVSKKEIKFPGAGYNMTLLIWDIMGRKDFLSLFKESYFMNAKGIIAVFDTTRRGTMHSLDLWISSIGKKIGDIPTIILANKSDLHEQNSVTDGEIIKAAEGQAFRWLRTSAKTGENVERGFRELAVEMLRTYVSPFQEVDTAH